MNIINKNKLDSQNIILDMRSMLELGITDITKSINFYQIGINK